MAQAPDVLGSFMRGTSARDVYDTQQAAAGKRNYLQEYGQAMASGDESALAGYAQHDLKGAMGLQSHFEAKRRAAANAADAGRKREEEADRTRLSAGMDAMAVGRDRIMKLPEAERAQAFEDLQNAVMRPETRQAIAAQGIELTLDNMDTFFTRIKGDMGETWEPYGGGADANPYTLGKDQTRFSGNNVKVAQGVQSGEEKPTFRAATPEEAAGYGAKSGQIDEKSGRFYPINPPSGMRLTTDEDGNMVFEQGPGVTDGQATARTKGQIAADKAFSKEYTAYIATGGLADSVKQIEQLETAIVSLESGESLTGPVLGLLPDWALSVANPKALDTREIVEEVVQRNLRLILGAQFTEKEGERLIARAYNPKLSEKINAKRVGNLIRQMKRAADAKLSAAKYWEEHQTLGGWQGTQLKVEDFQSMDFGSDIGASIESIEAMTDDDVIRNTVEMLNNTTDTEIIRALRKRLEDIDKRRKQ